MNQTFAVGDLHYGWNIFADKLELLPEGSSVIQVGDVGLGFSGYPLSRLSQTLESVLEKNDLTLYLLKGNHENPVIWQETPSCPRIIMLQDFEERIINGKNYFFVGGAVSIDKSERTENIDWWPDEVIPYDKYVAPKNKVDVLVTHSAPDFCHPVGFNDYCRYWLNKTPGLEKELLEERAFLARLCREIKPDQHFYGHMHQSITEWIDGCKHVLLNELEVKEITFPKALIV